MWHNGAICITDGQCYPRQINAIRYRNNLVDFQQLSTWVPDLSTLFHMDKWVMGRQIGVLRCNAIPYDYNWTIALHIKDAMTSHVPLDEQDWTCMKTREWGVIPTIRRGWPTC